jgi:hypothetical protein
VVGGQASVVGGQAAVVGGQAAVVGGQAVLPMFDDVSSLLLHTNVDQPFDDFAQQRLLPKRLSQAGPGVAWVDPNGSGRDDLVIGPGRGGTLTVFHNTGDGKFTRLAGVGLDRAWTNGAGGLAAAPLAPGKVALLVGTDRLEASGTNTTLSQFNLGAGEVGLPETLSAAVPCAGPLAWADIDGDGDLDLFVGGRWVPGRFPEPAASAVFRNEKGKLIFDPAWSEPFKTVGLVSGAVFTDVDGDGRPDLVLACQWGPIRCYRNSGNHFVEITHQLGLDKFQGLWNSVAVGDFDGDGRMDLVAGNVGLNCAYQQFAPGPWDLFYGDFVGDGQVHVLEAYLDPQLHQVVPWRQMTLIEKDLPWIRQKFPTHHAFSTATMADILGPRAAQARQVTANHLTSTLFLNRGGHFEPHPLPAEAQFAPVYGLAVADFDGDGQADLFLAQNDFALREEDARMDAGRGLLLLGDGHGAFKPVPGQVSGIAVYDQQRGCAVADYDGDGRMDLVVAQNRAATRLFHNRSARPALRVRLAGPPANPWAIGATVRLKSGQQLGPAWEIHAGGGYWSQDSSTLLLAGPESAQTVQVRWPGGALTEVSVPAGSRDLVLRPDGSIQP